MLNDIGDIYRKLGDYEKAMQYFLEAMKIAEKTSNQKALAKALGSIGVIYYFQNNNTKALDYYLREFKITEKIADKAIKEVQKIFGKPVVTEVKPLENFYAAEDYHQDYYKKNPNAPYCLLVIRPKLEKLKLK